MKIHQKTVYLLHHITREDQGDEDVKLVGVYTSRVTAEATVERLRMQPGFIDYPEGFNIEEYELDKDHWTEGFLTE